MVTTYWQSIKRVAIVELSLPYDPHVTILKFLEYMYDVLDE